MKKIVITYGLISGAISALMMGGLMGLLYNSSKPNDFSGSMMVGYISMVLAFIIIYPGMVSYRKNVGMGQVSYGRALSVGLLITAIACVIYAIAWMIVCKTMMPDFMDKYTAYSIDKMRAKGASATEISATMAEMAKYKDMYKNPITMFLLTYMEPLPVGILISLISAFAVSTKKTRNPQLT